MRIVQKLWIFSLMANFLIWALFLTQTFRTILKLFSGFHYLTRVGLKQLCARTSTFRMYPRSRYILVVTKRSGQNIFSDYIEVYNYQKFHYSNDLSTVLMLFVHCKCETVTILVFSCVSVQAVLQLLFQLLVVGPVTSESCTTTTRCKGSNYQWLN